MTLPNAVDTVVSDQAPTSPESGQSADSQTPTIDQAPEATDQPESFTSVDPSTLPPELQATYKSLQADYTRKTQNLAEINRKAAAFEEVMSNPNLSKMVATASTQPGESPAPQETPMSGEELLVKILDDPQALFDIVDKRAEEIANRKLEPLSEKVYSKEADTEITRLSQKYPDFLDHESQIVETMEKYGLDDPESAYKLVTYDKIEQKGVDRGVQVTEARIKGAQPESSTAPVVKAGKMSFQEAFEQAKRSQGWTGK